MSELLRVACADEVPPGTGKEVIAGGRVIALYNVEGEFYAIDGICPHAGGPLGRGALNGNIVTCPWHGWQFEVTSGQHCLNANIRQAAFPVTVRGTDVFVELP